ncbi:hypothetical protein PGTUg99_017955 [Puccinia graminis f. sp. tritici]|uniref:Uncharacterized protein n=1 Tax=Puccinia graminis f. sp. tritici TaxID=56615 RepID=A0A5B0PVY5_PUCGR|nr:hypothetical protein PGTUg99_017955 [Puccinia graminis f. sp. tritici]
MILELSDYPSPPTISALNSYRSVSRLAPRREFWITLESRKAAILNMFNPLISLFPFPFLDSTNFQSFNLDSWISNHPSHSTSDNSQAKQWISSYAILLRDFSGHWVYSLFSMIVDPSTASDVVLDARIMMPVCHSGCRSRVAIISSSLFPVILAS